ncbi:MAG: tetratricopeptide repeat protein [Anaerolineales bacterium]
MKGSRLMLVLWVLIPLIVAVAFNLSPQAYALDELWIQARQAHRWQQLSQQIKALRGITTFEPWRADLWEQIGDLEMASGGWRDAIEAYQTAKGLGGLSSEGQIALGSAFWNLGEREQAAAYWSQLMANEELSVGAYAEIAGLYRKAGDFSNAEKTLRNWLRQAENDPQANYQLGLLLSPNRPQEALTYLQRVKEEPGLVSKASVLESIIVTVSHERDPGYRSLQIGRTLGSLEEWDMAALAFEAAIRASPGYAEAWALLGEAQQHLGQDGLPQLQYALELKPDSTLAQALLALYWRRHGKPQVAMQYLLDIAEKEPKRAVWLVELGNTAAENGDNKTALGYFRKAAEIEPQSPLVWRSLVQFCLSQGLLLREEGLPAARQLLVLTPDDPVALDLMGAVLLNLEDLESSERFLQLAIQRDQAFPDAHLHLGQVYLLMEQLDAARYHLKQAIELSEEGDSMWRMAKRLLERNFSGE